MSSDPTTRGVETLARVASFEGTFEPEELAAVDDVLRKYADYCTSNNIHVTREIYSRPDQALDVGISLMQVGGKDALDAVIDALERAVSGVGISGATKANASGVAALEGVLSRFQSKWNSSGARVYLSKSDTPDADGLFEVVLTYHGTGAAQKIARQDVMRALSGPEANTPGA